MKLAEVFPPADLLEGVRGIERGLRQRKRLGVVWWVGTLLSLLSGLKFTALSSGSDLEWPALLAAGLAVCFLFLAIRTKFWLRESREPFRYTCSIGDFELVTEGVDADFAWLPDWLRHDLYEKLSERVGRFSFLDEAHVSPAAADDGLSHIHMDGSYLLRRQDPGGWVVEVAPRVRLGAPGSPETFAHRVKLHIGELPEPPSLSEADYAKILERVYFSVASEIYLQIRHDVEAKIELLPTDYLRATAYFHEAADYELSNTLDAYEQAQALYAAARELFSPVSQPAAGAGLRPRLRYRLRKGVGRTLRLAAARWPRLAKREVMAAKADIGYANMLLYRRVLAGLSGRRLNPIFEARPVAIDAVTRLEMLPRGLPGVPEALFDARVTLALAWHYLGSPERAEEELTEARSLLPARVEQSARYLFASALLEPLPRSALPLIRRAAELDPRFEVAQFALARKLELLWRSRPGLEAAGAKLVFREYEGVLRLNPGNIGAWAALGYMHWLLGDLEGADAAYQRGREYKEIKHETFVAELDFGLARIAAERGRLEEAYAHYIAGASASVSQGVSRDNSALSEYFFELIEDAMLDRFCSFRAEVERRLRALAEQEAAEPAPRVRESVASFVLNVYGEACFNYYLRTGDRKRLHEASTAYHEARDRNPAYVLPHYNLCLLEVHRGEFERAIEHIDRAVKLEPRWPDGMLALVTTYAHWADVARREADSQRAVELEAQLRAQELRAESEEARQRSFSLPWTAVQAEIASTDESVPIDKDAYELLDEAEAREARADRAERRVKELERTVSEVAPNVAKHIRALLPHDWLWAGPELDLRLLDREDLSRRRVWERELDDLHVRALRTWATARVLLETDDAKRRDLHRLLGFLLERYWADDFELLLASRGLPGHDDAYEKIERTLSRQLAGDPACYSVATWFRSLGDWLGAEGLLDSSEGRRADKRRRALEAYHRATATSDPDLLLELAERFEELGEWDRSRETYRRARERRAAAIAAGAEPVHQEARCHRGLGRALWQLERHREAVGEWERIDGAGGELGEGWRTAIVRNAREQVDSHAAYRRLCAWLEHEQRESVEREDGAAGRDVSQALFLLARGNYQRWRREEGAPVREIVGAADALPGAAPIVLEADERLFPEKDRTPQVIRLIRTDLPEMKRRIRERTGVELPGFRIRALGEAEPGAYALVLHETAVARGKLPPGKWYCPDVAGCRRLGIEEAVTTLWDGRKGLWLPESDWSRAGKAGLSLWDPYQFMVFHLEGLLSRHLAGFVGVQEVRTMLDEWGQGEDGDERRSLLEEAVGDGAAEIRLVRVLQRLVGEGVPVRSLTAIMTSFRQAGARVGEVDEIVEAARRSLIAELPGNEGSRRLVGLSPSIERVIAGWVSERCGRRFLAVPAGEARKLLEALGDGLGDRQARDLALVVSEPWLRPFVRRLTESHLPDLAVLSEAELATPFVPLEETVEYAR